MSRPLTKSESADGNEVAWYTDDKSFLMVVRHVAGEFIFDITFGKAKYTGIRSRKIGVSLPDPRVDEVYLPPWEEEVFFQISSRTFGRSTVKQYVQRLHVPLRRGISVLDSTAILTRATPEPWLSRMVFYAKSKDLLLPYLDEKHRWMLLATSLYSSSSPAHRLQDNEELDSCGFWCEGKWWISATANTPKGQRHRLFAESKHKVSAPPYVYELPSTWARDGRLRLLEDGTIQASREAYGDRWTKAGTF